MRKFLFTMGIVIFAVLITNCGIQVLNTEPYIPSNPIPSDKEIDVVPNVTLNWSCSDPDGDILVYDVYFGIDSNPPLVKKGHTSRSYSPGFLQYNTKYYWKIVAKDSSGRVGEGPVWSFTTVSFSATVYGKIVPYTGDVTKTSSTSTKVFSSNMKTFEELIPGEYIVQFDLTKLSKSNDSLISSLKTYGFVVDQLHICEKTFYLLKTELSLSQIEENFSRLPGFVNIEPNYLFRLLNVLIPNDPSYSQQWNYPMIKLPYAWYMTTSTELITIAVVDSGVDSDHQDLQGLFINGFDFVQNDLYPQDESGHGTHVAGVICALTNNNKGIAGITWGRTKILPLRVFDASGSASSLNVAKAFVYAVDHGAKIINFSGGSSAPSSVIKQAVKYAYDNDVIIVCAAGNDGTYGINYPAAYDETIAVGAVNSSGQRTWYSNYGPELDIVAPGGDESGGILSTYLNNAYEAMIGTSMATPHITGVIALMISQGITDVEDIRAVLRKTAIDLGDQGWDQYYGAGLVDAYAAVTWQDDWEPLIVYSVNEKYEVDQITFADNQGNYQFDVKSQNVLIYAWMDFDHDNEISSGDLFGYYGYVSGDPLKGLPEVINLNFGEQKRLDFKIAPLIDTTNRPVLSSYQEGKLAAFKEKIVQNYYKILKGK